LGQAQGVEDGLTKIRELQRSWIPSEQQVSVVMFDRLVLHVQDKLQGTTPDFVDEKSGAALYPGMREERQGLRLAKIRGFGPRRTAIAFETVEKPPCMVIAEAHYEENSGTGDPAELGQKEVAIMRLFSDGRTRKLIPEGVAEVLSISRLEAEKLLESLEERQFLRHNLVMGGPSWYSLSRKGRDYLLENGLLSEG
jgi:type II secretory pathway predicted ATPase ExeA